MDFSCVSMINATTACSGFVSVGINPSGELQQKTRLVVLYGPPRQETMMVYRQSTTAPGKLTADRYSFDCDAWTSPREDPYKYETPPFPPEGAVTELVGGIQYWTLRPMSEPEKDRVRELSRAARKRLKK